MTNYEKLKQMSIDDMADFLNSLIIFCADEEPYISMVIGVFEHDVHQTFGDLIEFLKAEVK